MKSSKEQLKQYIKRYWPIIPGLSNVKLEGINELICNGETYNTGNPNEYISIKREEDNIYKLYIYYVMYDEQKQIQSKAPMTKMGFQADNKFHGTMLKENMKFCIEADGELEINYYSFRIIKDMIESIIKTKTIVINEENDLDNKVSLYALEKWLRDIGTISEHEILTIEKVPKGTIKKGYLNINTGKESGNIVDKESETVLIDKNIKIGINSICQALDLLGVPIPEQILEVIQENKKHENEVPMSYIEYLSGEQIFKLAELKLMEESLTIDELKKYGLYEAYMSKQEDNER